MKQSEHRLLKYVSSNVPVFEETVLVGKAQDKIRQGVHEYDSIDYVYFYNEQQHLSGVLSVRDLFKAKREMTLHHVFGNQPVITISDQDRPEKAAYLAVKQQLKAVPVLDTGGHFVGAICNQELNKIVYYETRYDLLRLAGLSKQQTVDNILEISVWQSFLHRFPWLILGLGGGLITAGVVEAFKLTLERNLMLAAFIPLIVYMSDAVGTQTEAFVIRDFAIDHKLRYLAYFVKQVVVVTMIAVVTSVALAVYGWLRYGNLALGVVLGLALLLATVSSVITGLFIPFGFSRLKQDPANASGPIATIVQDFLSVLIYFSVATMLLT